MAVRIICVGKRHESWVREGIERYETRLHKPYDVEWVLLPHSPREGVTAREEESGAILSRVKPGEYVVLCDETGRNIDSPALSQQLQECFVQAKPVVMIIGGAYGVDSTVHHRADMVWSLSRLVFPHQLVRLILAEQIYRAQEIARGSGYHHE